VDTIAVNPHDPGVEVAAATAAEIPAAPAAEPIPVPGGGAVRVGTASWTDPTMTARGVFYPAGVSTAEDRLRYYCSQFSVVEVDSTYYALPARTTAELWVERTPPGFMFDIKAHALMGGQPSEVKRLPKALREALPPALAEKTRVYAHDLPPEIYDEVWQHFREGIKPLQDAGRVDTSWGQAALLLARRLDSTSAESGSGVAALGREHGATMAEATRGVKVAGDLLDELKARRDRQHVG